MNIYCSKVCTHPILYLRIKSTTSNTDNLFASPLAQRIASISAPKVPVLPIPAEQWSRNISSFNVRQSSTNFLIIVSLCSPKGLRMSPQPVHSIMPKIHGCAPLSGCLRVLPAQSPTLHSPVLLFFAKRW